MFNIGGRDDVMKNGNPWFVIDHFLFCFVIRYNSSPQKAPKLSLTPVDSAITFLLFDMYLMIRE